MADPGPRLLERFAIHSLPTPRHRHHLENSHGMPPYSTRTMALVGAAWSLRTMEPLLLILTRSLVERSIRMSSKQLRFLGAAVFIGSTVGSLGAGIFGDSCGRRRTLLVAAALSALGLAGTAMARAYPELLVGHILAGLGLGAELPSALTLLYELGSQRGDGVAMLGVFGGIGAMSSVALAFAAGPTLGWRRLYLAVSAMAAIHAGLMYWWMPESPKWSAIPGNTKRVAQLPEIEPEWNGVDEERATVDEVSFKSGYPSGWRLLWREYRLPLLRLSALWTVFSTSSYVFTIYVPTLISLEGFAVFGSWNILLILRAAETLGATASAYCIIRRGVGRSLVVFAAMTVVSACMLAHLPWTSLAVTFATALASLAAAGSWNCVLTSTPPYFPPSIRGRAVGCIFAISCAADTLGLFLYPYLFNEWRLSAQSIAWLFVGVLLIVMALSINQVDSPTVMATKNVHDKRHSDSAPPITVGIQIAEDNFKQTSWEPEFGTSSSDDTTRSRVARAIFVRSE